MQYFILPLMYLLCTKRLHEKVIFTRVSRGFYVTYPVSVMYILSIDNIPVHMHHQQASGGPCCCQQVLLGLFEMRQPVFREVTKYIYIT